MATAKLKTKTVDQVKLTLTEDEARELKIFIYDYDGELGDGPIPDIYAALVGVV